MMKLDMIAVSLLIVLLVLFGLRRIFHKKSFIKQRRTLWDSTLFGLTFILLGYNFYVKGPRIGLVAVGMGAVAVGKYFFDRNKNPEDSGGL